MFQLWLIHISSRFISMSTMIIQIMRKQAYFMFACVSIHQMTLGNSVIQNLAILLSTMLSRASCDVGVH